MLINASYKSVKSFKILVLQKLLVNGTLKCVLKQVQHKLARNPK